MIWQLHITWCIALPSGMENLTYPHLCRLWLMYDIYHLYLYLTSHYACAVMLCVTYVPALTIVISVHLCVCMKSKYLESANYVDASVSFNSSSSEIDMFCNQCWKLTNMKATKNYIKTCFANEQIPQTCDFVSIKT